MGVPLTDSLIWNPANKEFWEMEFPAFLPPVMQQRV